MRLPLRRSVEPDEPEENTEPGEANEPGQAHPAEATEPGKAAEAGEAVEASEAAAERDFAKAGFPHGSVFATAGDRRGLQAVRGE